MNVVGIGTDITEIQRIADMIQRHGDAFFQKVFTSQEVEYCQARKASAQHFAGRWAAKEAVLKALGTGWSRGIRWRDVEVRNDLSGKPSIVLSGDAADISGQLGIETVLISISHCHNYATAYALAVGPSSV